ncbi:MAG: hypothetical protein VXZ67_06670 [Pseudomonadota bacterium]|nr:hypothetical protein [Pseudomonadota bacterium]
MTVNEKLVEFERALNPLIERAMSCVGDADAFLAANTQIEQLVSAGWPDLVSALSAAGPSTEELAIIRTLSAALSRLETQSRARLVWADDFDEYMRQALARAPT